MSNVCTIDPREVDHTEAYYSWIDRAGVPDSDEAAAAWVEREVARWQEEFEVYMEGVAQARAERRRGDWG